MDKRMKEILHNIEKNPLNLDDTFQFKCRGCGKCCRNREDILLTARDIYNIACFLGRTTEYIFNRYCESYVGSSSRMPLVRLRPSGPTKACPLQLNKRCIVHEAKPAVCALYPLGRVADMQDMEEDAATPAIIEPKYFLQPTKCGSPDRAQTVRSWLERFGIPVEDDFYALWTETITFISETFHLLESEEIAEKTLEVLWNVAFAELYINYETEKELIPQFNANTAKLRDAFTGIRSMADQLFGRQIDGK